MRIKKRNKNRRLIEKDKRFLSVTAKISEVLWTRDINGHTSYISSNIKNILGFTDNEIYDSNPSLFYKRVHPNDLIKVKDALNKLFIKNIKFNIKYRILNKNNEWKWLNNKSIQVYKKNGIRYADGIFTDITEIKNTEASLRESEEKYKLLFYNSPNGIFTATADGKILDINNTWLNLLGSPSIEALKEINIVKHQPLIDSGYTEKFKNTIKTGETNKFEMFYKSKWGKSIHISNTIVPIKDNDGNIIKIQNVTEDISNRKKTENKIQEQTKDLILSIKKARESERKLRKNNKTLNKFFSIIAHDLKSPFQSMLGFSAILKEDYSNHSYSEQIEYIEIINNGLNNTYKLLDNLLSWCHLQNGTINYNPKFVNLHALTNDTIELLKPQAKNKCISLDNKIKKSIQINADKDMLSTIIRNLISNAIKFTNKGGRIKIYVQINESNTQITVEDNGIGISKEKQSQIFSINENSSTKGTENESGSGLGLILCKEFVEKHNGKIWVESKIGEGSKFSFTIAS